MSTSFCCFTPFILLHHVFFLSVIHTVALLKTGLLMHSCLLGFNLALISNPLCSFGVYLLSVMFLLLCIMNEKIKIKQQDKRKPTNEPSFTHSRLKLCLHPVFKNRCLGATQWTENPLYKAIAVVWTSCMIFLIFLSLKAPGHYERFKKCLLCSLDKL